MIMAGTLIILALWLAFVFRFVDPDGYRNARREQSAKGGSVHPHKTALNARQLETEENSSPSRPSTSVAPNGTDALDGAALCLNVMSTSVRCGAISLPHP